MTREVGWRRAAFVVATGFPFVFLAAFVAYPLWQEIGGSFSGWYQLKPHGFEGTHNYAALFNDVVARVAALHSVFYLLLTVPVEVGLGLAAAWMTLRVARGQGLLAAIFLIPLVVPWTVAGTLFYGLFNIHGVADRVSQDVFGGGSSFLWLEHPRLAFGVIVVFGIWKGAPWCYLLLLGALSTCPEEVFEAARIDGARGLSFWWRVVLPAIRPMLVFVVVLRLLAEAQTFNSVAMLTNGGPSFPGATELVGFYANVLAFGYYNFGEASAMGTLIGAVLVIVAIAGWMLAFPRRVGRRRLFNNVGPQSDTGAPASRVASRAWHWAANAWRRSPAAGPDEVRGTLSHSMRWAKRSRWALLAVMVVLVLLPFAGEAEFWLGRHEFSGTFWPAIETGAWNSLILSAATVVGTLVLAVPAAYSWLMTSPAGALSSSSSCSSPWLYRASYSSSRNSKRSSGLAWSTPGSGLSCFTSRLTCRWRCSFCGPPLPVCRYLLSKPCGSTEPPRSGYSEGLYCGSRRARSSRCRC